MQPPTDPELLQLLELIERGIHDPSEVPFLTSRTDTPSSQRERDSLSHWWRLRAVVAHDWKWSGAVHANGPMVGIQDLMGKDFAATRHVKSASRLGLDFPGPGHRSRDASGRAASGF
jgi:hypothetical protein